MAKKQLTKQTIGVGVAGTGFIGPAHIEGLRRAGINVLGLAERTKEKAEKKAAEMGIPRIYGSLDEMLADPDIDVVHLATPNYLHHSHAKAALLAGKHVVCEKPLAMTAKESGELVQLAAEKKLVNVVNFNIRMYPMAQQARSMVQSGELGEVFILQGSYLQDWLLFPTDWNWRLEPSLGGSLRAVGDIGSHWLDLLTFITGLHVEEVYADFKTFHPVRKKPAKPLETFTGKILTPEDYIDQPINTEDYATIILHYENGVRGVLTVSQISAGRKNRLFYEINGSKSSLGWDSEKPNELWIGHRTEPNQVLMKDPSLLSPEARAVSSYPGGHNEGFPDTFKQLYTKVYNYILAGDFDQTPDFPTFADGHYEMQLCEAIERSAREKTWIKVKIKETHMKLGFLTAALPDNTLEQAAKWGAESGFQAIEITCWPFEKAARRYAGVTHIDVSTLDNAKAKEIRNMLDGYGLTISSLAYYPNPLHPEADHRETVIAHLKKVIEGAALLEVPIVGTFIGKDKNKTVPQNLEDYAKIWPPIVKFAKDHGVKIAIENCPMLFSLDEWPGGNNLASTPAIWRKMWEIIPDDNFGLNLDPSHLILQMIDYERVIREFSSKIFHVHAKDLHIDHEGLYNNGVLSQGMGWQVPRLPGLGDVDWAKFFAALKSIGYDDVVSIEHEDRNYEGDEELIKRGFYLSRDVLKPLMN